MFDSLEFKGKVALVTGGSAGIGKATAFAFAQSGAKIVIASRRITEGEKTAREISVGGGDAIFIPTDISKANEVEALINKTVDIFGRLDYACNNAGVAITGSLVEHSEEQWEQVIGTNLKGVWLCLKYEILAMQKQSRGAIVNISSAASVTGGSNHAIYAASKGGVVSLTRSAALEFAKSNITINTISPGPVRTDMLDTAPQEFIRKIAEEQPIGRIGKSDEIADAVLWMCSERASYFTGQNLLIDGGYTTK